MLARFAFCSGFALRGGGFATRTPNSARLASHVAAVRERSSVYGFASLDDRGRIVAWVVLWRVRFDTMERVFGLAGLALVVAVLKLPTDWGELRSQARSPVPTGTGNWGTYAFQGEALFAAGLTPYEVFFFSSGGVEERWTARDLVVNKANVFVGFPLGGLLSLALMGVAAVVWHPIGVRVETLAQTALPVAMALGKIGLAVVILGFFAATFGAAMETGLSAGYTIAQYFGGQWGKRVRPAQFHVVLLVSILIGVAALFTTIDPVLLTEYTLVFSAVVLPLTYLPILVVANDRDYLGDRVNGRLANGLGMVYLVLIVVVAVAAIPLMIATGMGG